MSLFLYKEISSNKAVIEELSFIYLNNSTSVGEEVNLGLFNSLLKLNYSLLIKLFYIIIRDLLDISLIIFVPRNSLLLPKLVIFNLEDLVKS